MLNKILIGTGITAVILAISYHFYTQFNLLTKYEIENGNSYFTKIGFTIAELNHEIILTNKSEIDATILGYKVRVDLNGKKVGFIQSNLVQKIKSKSKSKILVGISFNPTEVVKMTDFKIAKDVLMGKLENLVFDFNGNIRIRQSDIFTFNVPIKFSMTLKDMLDIYKS